MRTVSAFVTKVITFFRGNTAAGTARVPDRSVEDFDAFFNRIKTNSRRIR